MAEIIPFAIACILLIITPGPGVLSVAGTGAGFGFSRGSRYLWGLCLGNTLVAAAVASGIAATVFATPYIREILLFISVAYMIYLAVKIAFAGSRIGFIEADIAPGFRDGVLLQMINPKAYVANSFLFSAFNFLPESFLAETMIKYVIWTTIWIPMHFAWLIAGVTLRRMSLSARMQRSINIMMALSMVMVVFIALFTNR